MVLSEGEELVYNVRYSFIDLGQVRIRTISRLASTHDTIYLAKALIQSYAGVPFVDLKATYESWMGPTTQSRRFVGRTKEGKTWNYSRYEFEYDRHRVLVESGSRDSVVEERDTLNIDQTYNDGLSLFFFARQHVLSGKRMNIPTFVNGEKVNTFIDFKNKRTSVEVDAIQYPVDVVEFEGTAEFVGIFGLTGDFEGWFSHDEARVPIVAKMKVIIGSITLELIEWTRTGWVPPKSTE